METQQPEVAFAARAFCCLVLVALTGCSGGRPPPLDYRSETNRPLTRSELGTTQPSGDKTFGGGFDANWRKLGGPETDIPAAASSIPAAAASARSSLTPEEREFEDWRAWQEWKRRNPKQ